MALLNVIFHVVQPLNKGPEIMNQINDLAPY